MTYLILAFIGFIAALTPGPDIFFIIRNGLCYGLKEAILATIGILTGNLIYLFLVYIGLSIVGNNPYFQFIIGIFGAVYLLRISILIFKEKVRLNNSCTMKKNSYLQGLFLNLSNPKAMLFFSIVITPFLGKNIKISLLALFSGIALAFFIASVISSKIELKEKSLNLVNKVIAIIFLIFSLKLFLLAYESFFILFK